MSYKIYTKTGDKGTTSLIGGTRMSKASARLEAYGTADELNSFVGLLRAKLEVEPRDAEVEEIDSMLKRIQNKLFNLGGFLATDTSVTQTCEATEVAQEEVIFLEEQIDKIQSELEPIRGFILPGGDEAISVCHVCRTVARRLERRMVALFDEESMTDPKVQNSLQYVNRLSDFLFVLSKKIAKMRKKELFLWEK